MRRLLARSASTLIAVATTACTTLRPVPLPRRAEAVDRITHAVLLLASGERVELYDVQLTRDSVVGRTAGSRDTPAERRAVATREVVQIEEARFSSGKTIAAIALTTASVLVLAIGVACASAVSGG